MPIVAILLGIILIDLGFRGTEHEFATQLSKDFGGGGFWAWLAAIAIIGSIGYYAPARRISDLGIALVVLGLIFSNKDTITNFAQTFTSLPQAAPHVPLPTYFGGSSSSSASSGSASSGGGGFGLGGAGGGAAQGAVAGSVFGPEGTLVGAGIGAIVGGLG